jgi:GDP-fucose transporter C1
MTVFLSSLLLHTRPSLRILFSCLLVTSGFLVGVIMDNPSSRPISASWVGITFGLLSSLTTSLHAVVIKKSLAAVNGSALELAWYSNVLSACVLAPIVFLSGEVPDILDLFLGAVSPTDGDGLSALATFVWGSAITVSLMLSHMRLCLSITWMYI